MWIKKTHLKWSKIQRWKVRGSYCVAVSKKTANPTTVLFICFIRGFTAAAAKSLQSCPTLCDPIDSSPSGSPIPGILQARTLEWVATSFSSAWKWKLKVKSLSRVRLLVTPWTAAHQGSSIHGIFQARVLEWGAIAFSRGFTRTPQSLFN